MPTFIFRSKIKKKMICPFQILQKKSGKIIKIGLENREKLGKINQSVLEKSGNPVQNR